MSVAGFISGSPADLGARNLVVVVDSSSSLARFQTVRILEGTNIFILEWKKGILPLSWPRESYLGCSCELVLICCYTSSFVNSINDCSRAGSCSLATEILVLELDHSSLDGKYMAEGIEGVMALCSPKFLLIGYKACNTDTFAIR